jgi:mannosyltransferase
LNYLDAPSLGDFLHSVRRADPTMTPVFFTCVYVWASLFGDSLYMVKLLPVTLGMATLVLLFVVGRKFYGNRAGLIAAALAALAVTHVFYAQEVRMYCLLLPLVLSSALTFQQCIVENKRWAWPLHLFFNALIPWTHLLGAFFLLAEGVILVLFYWRDVRKLALWMLPHALLIATLGIYTLTINMRQLDVAASGIGKPGLRTLLSMPTMWAGGRLYESFDPSIYMPWHCSLDLVQTGLVLALAAWQIGAFVRRRGVGLKFDDLQRELFLLAWLALPVICLFWVSRLVRPCLLGRYTLFSSLALYLLAGGAVANIKRKPAALAVAALTIALFAYQVTFTPRPLHLGWKAAAAHLAEGKEPANRVFVLHSFNTTSLEYNARQLGLQLPKIATIEDTEDLSSVIKHAAPDPALLIVWSDRTEMLDKTFSNSGIRFVKEDIPGGFPHLTLYSFPAAN